MIKNILGMGLVACSFFFIVSPTSAYTVEAGDTLSKIARNNEMSLSEVLDLNPHITNPNLIYIGESINTNMNNQANSVSVPTDSIGDADLDILARLVSAEAKGESYAGKVAVAEVVLNRVQSPEFPDSIKEVIYQSGQFSPVSNGSINSAADPQSINAAKEAMSHGDVTGGALFFYNPRIASSRWLDHKTTTLILENHVFKK